MTKNACESAGVLLLVRHGTWDMGQGQTIAINSLTSFYYLVTSRPISAMTSPRRPGEFWPHPLHISY